VRKKISVKQKKITELAIKARAKAKEDREKAVNAIKHATEVKK